MLDRVKFYSLSSWLVTLIAIAASGCDARHTTTPTSAIATPQFAAIDGKNVAATHPRAGGWEKTANLRSRRFNSESSTSSAGSARCPRDAVGTNSAAATSSTMQTTSDGMEEDAASDVPTWKELDVTLTVDPSFQSSPGAMQALEAALNAWTSVAPELPRASIRIADTTVNDADPKESRSDHRVYYAPNGDARANGALAITVVTTDLNTKSILDADIIVNGKHVFNDIGPTKSTNASPVYDLQSVLAHEMGHWFGLGENYCNSDATMYAYLAPNETIKRDLAEPDVVAAQLAYWQADNPGGEVGCSIANTSSGPSSRKLACVIAISLGLRWRRAVSRRGTRKPRTHTERA